MSILQGFQNLVGFYQTYLQGQKRPCRKQKTLRNLIFAGFLFYIVVTECNSALSGMQFRAIGSLFFFQAHLVRLLIVALLH